MDIQAILSTSDFFRGLSQRSKDALAGICLPRQIEKGKTLFREGDKGMAVYICIHGNIRLHKSADRGKEVVIRVIGPGEFFAEAMLFEQDRYPVSAVALTKCTVAMIPRHQFHCLLDAPDFRREFIAGLMAKLRFLADRIKYLTVSDVRHRLMLFLRDQYGVRQRITCLISKKEVAAAIGATPESLSRALQQLRREKVVEWKGRELIIADGFWETQS